MGIMRNGGYWDYLREFDECFLFGENKANYKVFKELKSESLNRW